MKFYKISSKIAVSSLTCLYDKNDRTKMLQHTNYLRDYTPRNKKVTLNWNCFLGK